MSSRDELDTLTDVTARHSDGHQVGCISKVPIQSDNCCLFSCFSFLLHCNRRSVEDIRRIAASGIESDPDTFNDLTLEKPRDLYLQWILQPDSWGGYIELIALSKAYHIQIVAVDIDSGRVDDYGDEQATKRIYLLYDGSHYDAVVGEDVCCPNEIITTFDSLDSMTLDKVKQLVSQLKLRQPLPIQPRIICYQCNEILKNTEYAKNHARFTGHTEFGHDQ